MESKTKNKNAQKFDWSNIDWTKTNMNIAIQFGISSQGYVQKMRKKLGKPAPVQKSETKKWGRK